MPEVDDVGANGSLDPPEDRGYPAAGWQPIRTDQDWRGVVGEGAAQEFEAADPPAFALDAERQKDLGPEFRIARVHQAGDDSAARPMVSNHVQHQSYDWNRKQEPRASRSRHNSRASSKLS